MQFILWNFVNLIDAEGGWLVQLVITLTCVAIITHLLKIVLHRLHKKFEETHQVWKDTFVRAIYRPVSYYIWLVTLTHSVNLISDQLLSRHFLDEAKMALSVLAVLTVSWFLLAWKKNLLEVLVAKQKAHEIQMDTGRIVGFGKLATMFTLVVTGLLLMEVTGQSFKTLIAFGGISGLALAIASQEIIANFFGGLMIYITQPFTVQDYILLPSSNLEGYVEDIGWYQTCLRPYDKKPVYVPNSFFSKAHVINSSRMTHRRLNEKISVRHEDLAVVPKILDELEEYLSNHAGIDKEEKILASIENVGPYSVDIVISAMTVTTDEREFSKIKDSLFVKTGQVIDKNGAKIASAHLLPVPKSPSPRESSFTNE